jgi:prolipoprotein diacylglyceryltransferase
MYPEILHIPFLHTYGALVALAFLAGLGMATRLAKASGLNADAVVNLGIYCALSAIAGAKLMMFLVDIPYYSRYPSEIFTLATLQAGGVFYGGLIAALAVAWWYMRKTRLPGLKTADVFAPAIALGHGIGRLGCFSAGCCWGLECHLPWAVTFTNPVANQLVGVPDLRRALLAHSQAAPSRRHHQPLPDAVFHRAIRGGVLPLPRAGQSLRRTARHRAVDFAGPLPSGRRLLRGQTL